MVPLLICSNKCPVQISVGTLIILTEVCHRSPQSLKVNAGIVLQYKEWLLCFTSFQIRYSLIILSVSAILAEVLTQLNKS